MALDHQRTVNPELACNCTEGFDKIQEYLQRAAGVEVFCTPDEIFRAVWVAVHSELPSPEARGVQLRTMLELCVLSPHTEMEPGCCWNPRSWTRLLPLQPKWRTHLFSWLDTVSCPSATTIWKPGASGSVQLQYVPHRVALDGIGAEAADPAFTLRACGEGVSEGAFVEFCNRVKWFLPPLLETLGATRERVPGAPLGVLGIPSASPSSPAPTKQQNGPTQPPSEFIRGLIQSGVRVQKPLTPEEYKAAFGWLQSQELETLRVCMHLVLTEPSGKGSIRRRLQNSLHAIVQAYHAPYPANGVALLFTALEALLSTDGPEGIMGSITRNATTLLLPDPRQRPAGITAIKKLYGQRSAFVHGRSIEAEPHVLDRVRSLTCAAFRATMLWSRTRDNGDPDSISAKALFDELMRASELNAVMPDIWPSLAEFVPGSAS
jgi:hypothetical protein